MGTLADYTLEAILYRTGTGVVQGARYRPTGHRVALEQIAADLVATPGFVDRLAECGRQATALRHPCALPVHDLIAEQGQVWLVTGAADGRVLRSVCPAGSAMQPHAALAVVDDVLAALEAAHALGIVHGDINPEQVLVAGGGESVLRGFAVSLAVATTPGAPPWRQPAFASPERRAGAPPDPAGDLWATAVLARELLTGGVRGEPGRQAMPGAVADILAHALAEDPRGRFATATDLRRALHSAARRAGVPEGVWAGDLAGAVFRPGGAVATPSPTPPPARRAAAAPSYPRERGSFLRRHLGLVAGVLVLAVAAAAVALWFTVGPGAGGTVTAGPLVVDDDVSVSVQPSHGGCNTTFTFTAQGTMHGSGTITYSWQRQGAPPQTASQAITDQGSFAFTYPLTITGHQTVDGTMTFQVLDPTRRQASTSFSYSC